MGMDLPPILESSSALVNYLIQVFTKWLKWSQNKKPAVTETQKGAQTLLVGG